MFRQIKKFQIMMFLNFTLGDKYDKQKKTLLQNISKICEKHVAKGILWKYSFSFIKKEFNKLLMLFKILLFN